MGKIGIARELIDFLRKRKKWWIIPVITFLVLLGFIMFVSQASVVAPFIYVLF